MSGDLLLACSLTYFSAHSLAYILKSNPRIVDMTSHFLHPHLPAQLLFQKRDRHTGGSCLGALGQAPAPALCCEYADKGARGHVEKGLGKSLVGKPLVGADAEGLGGTAAPASASLRNGSQSADKSRLLAVGEDVYCTARRVGGDAIECTARRLLEWDDLEGWQKNNEFVLTGHRRASPCHVTSLRSVFHWHNETVNIWAHILGSFVFTLAGLAVWSKYAALEDVDQSDVRAVLVYFGGCVVCFAVSSV